MERQEGGGTKLPCATNEKALPNPLIHAGYEAWTEAFVCLFVCVCVCVCVCFFFFVCARACVCEWGGGGVECVCARTPASSCLSFRVCKNLSGVKNLKLHSLSATSLLIVPF